jgi:hypothetical protein
MLPFAECDTPDLPRGLDLEKKEMEERAGVRGRKAISAKDIS